MSAPSRIEAALAGPPGLAPYITAGDGGLDRTLEILFACEAAGARLVELGIPFSDPMADGPILQAAAERALRGGTTLAGALQCLARFRAGSSLPVAIFTYANPLCHLGYSEAARRLADAGADAVLIPDLPLEESAPVRDAMNAQGIATVLFCAPSTSTERLARIARSTQAFLYVIGRFGVTGDTTEVAQGLDALLDRVEAVAHTPLGVGFGLRTPEQVASVLKRVKLAIVGSALVDRLHHAVDPPAECCSYLKTLWPTV